MNLYSKNLNLMKKKQKKMNQVKKVYNSKMLIWVKFILILFKQKK